MKHRMFKRIRRSLAELRRSTSGNTAILVAAGMPALIGSAGLAVDTAQWYMWKREMQYAVDQAAIAGAWSKVKGSTGTAYQTRALQELNANLQIVDFHGTPTVALADYVQDAGMDDNSVVVTMSATKTLPFTSILTDQGATISVKAQARFQQGQTFTSCLIAVDPSTKGAIVVKGNAYIVAKCGATALSPDDEAISNDGKGVFDVGWLVSAGGIDDDFNGRAGLQIFERQTGLVDPFGDLAAPTSPGSKTYTCSPATTTFVATYTQSTTDTIKTYEGATVPTLALLSTSPPVTTGTVPNLTKSVTSTTKVGDTIVSTSSTASVSSTFLKPITTTTGTGKSKVTTITPTPWKRRIDTITAGAGVVTKITPTTIPGGAHVYPGTYTDFTVGCDTVMEKGVYVISGGQFATNATNKIRGEGVMIVLTNGAGIKINGSSETYLSAMGFDDMRNIAHFTEAQAIKYKDMLIFEDRNSSGDDNNKINGNAGTTLGGTVYLPKSKLTFSGSSAIASGFCLVIATKRIVFEGNTNMTSFCKDQTALGPSVGGGVSSVRLVG